MRSVKHPNVLLVEGRDECGFFGVLLEYLGLREVDVFDVGGKRKFGKELPVLIKTSGFSSVRNLGIVSDADDDRDDTFRSVRTALSKHSLPSPPSVGQIGEDSSCRVGVFIMPGADEESGMLEDLCMESVKDRPASSCVQRFVDCVSKLDEPPSNLSKARALAYLAAMKHPVACGDWCEKGVLGFRASLNGGGQGIPKEFVWELSNHTRGSPGGVPKRENPPDVHWELTRPLQHAVGPSQSHHR